MELDLLTTALIGLAVTILAALKPVVNAYSKALVRKADQLYREQPDTMSSHERKQVVTKALRKSMIGVTMPPTVLHDTVERIRREHENKTPPHS